MATYIIKQPNGLYAKFDTTIDEFLFWDATTPDVVADAIELATVEAARQSLAAIARADKGDTVNFNLSWSEALESHNSRCEDRNKI
jgi:hypothetical protein